MHAAMYVHDVCAVAIAFALLPTPVTKLVIGMVTAGEVERNMSDVAAATTVPIELWTEAWREGLVDATRVPFPAAEAGR